MPIMENQQTTTLFVFDNREVNYIIMYRDNVEENYHIKIFNYVRNVDCNEWYKVLISHKCFKTFKSAWTIYKLIIKSYLL